MRKCAVRGRSALTMRPTAGRSGLVQAGNAELFAELGADYLTNMPYNLAYRGREWNALPSRTAAKLDNYFTGVFTGTSTSCPPGCGARPPPQRTRRRGLHL